MQTFEFNIRSAVALEYISQQMIVNIFENVPCELKNRFVCIHNMYMNHDPKAILAKLVGITQFDDYLQFHLEVDGLSCTQLVTLQNDDVLVVFDANESQTEFKLRYIYWDEKNLIKPGLNFKTLINVSRLDKFQLEKYFKHPDYMLRGRNAIVRVMQIDTIDPDVVGGVLWLTYYKPNFPTIRLNYSLIGAEHHIGRINESSENDLVLIIFDKDGINPEFIYWED